MEPNLENQVTHVNENIDIFDEAAARRAEEYRKVIRQARAVLFIAGAVYLTAGLYYAFSKNDEEGALDLIAGAFFAAIYFALRYWSRSKPLIAMKVGLVVYLLPITISGIVNPASVVRGLLIHLVILGALGLGIQKARSLRQGDRILNSNK